MNWIHRPDWRGEDEVNDHCDWWTDREGALVRCADTANGHDHNHRPWLLES